ncbi:MAG: TlpA family protein disulfide reductase [Pseudomonadales bacterium]|nr:TlpA family protein disulfide reductase [Pseudomonadales bacterium]
MRTWTARLLAAVALVLASAAHAVPEVGDLPPSYLGKDQKGNKVDLEDLRGKVVIVTFWATWCPPCRKELPVLETIQQHAGRDRVQVVAVNIEKAMVYRPMKRRLKDYKMTLTNDHNGRIKKRFGVNGIPHMVMIKKDGTVAAIKRGYSEAMVPAVIDEVNALMRAEHAAAPDAR